MRLRIRLINNLLLILAVCVAILYIYFKFLVNKSNKYITVVKGNDQEIINRPLTGLADLEFLMDNNLCHLYKKDEELLAILIVTSYVGNDELRAAHRQAISQSKLAELGIQRVFLLAAIPEKERYMTQRQLQYEQEKFGDLLQGDFLEAYRNLSYKHIMGLKWASTECNKAKFIIKIDDDIVYDIFFLKSYLDSLELENYRLTNSAELLAGYVLNSKEVIRNPLSKWYVSEKEYPDNVYPSYLSGWLYITNPKTALRLVDLSYKTNVFWIDDIWVTGILREHLGITLRYLNSWFSANAEFLKCCVNDLKTNILECDFYVGPNGGDPKLLVEFLHNVEKCYYDECIKRNSEQQLRNTCVVAYKRILPDHGEANIRSVKLGR